MKCTQSREAMQVVGKGSTQLLFETSFDVKPPMSTAIGESYEVEITDFKVFSDRVLFKGTVDKTLYYKHPHGKKGKEGNTNQKDDKDKKDENDKKDDKKDDQSQNQQENSCDDSAESKSCKFLSKIKKHSRKGKKNQQKEKSSEKDNHKSGDKDQQTEKSEQKSSESNELTCLSGSGQLIDSAYGIVHFRQQVLEFAGTVEIPGVRPGDTIDVERAEGSTFEPLGSTASGNTIFGLIDKITQAFAVDVVLVATRSQPAKHSSTKEFSSLPADNNAETAE